MTKRRFLTLTHLPRYRPTAEEWLTMESRADAGPFTPNDRYEIARAAESYIQNMHEYKFGIEEGDLRRLNQSSLASLDRLIANLDKKGDGKERAVKRAYFAQVQVAVGASGDEELPEERVTMIVEQLEALHTALLKVGRLIDKPVIEFARTPAQSFEFFANLLQGLYERKIGPASARKDFDAWEVPSGYVRFVFAVWLSLPTYNEKTDTLRKMTTRLAGVLMPPEKSEAEV